MTTVRPAADGVVLTMPLLDVLVLRSSLDDFVADVGPAEQPPLPNDDPLAAWEREFAAAPEADEEPDDLSRRLFPAAYPDDPRASAEFRRFTETDLRRAKVREGETVAARLEEALAELIGDFHGPTEQLLAERGEHTAEVPVPAAEVQAWLKTLTGLRLRLSVELGIESGDDVERVENLDDDDPRALSASIFDWLGYVQEAILEALYA